MKVGNEAASQGAPGGTAAKQEQRPRALSTKFATSNVGLSSIALVIAAGVMSQGLVYVGGLLTACVLSVAFLTAMATGKRRPAVAAASEEARGDTDAGSKSREPEPLRWSYLPSNGMLRVNTAKTQDAELDNCSIKSMLLHRPTHKPREDASGKYPYSWHLHGRRRLWEIRVQIRFKVIPKGRMYFGIEVDYEEVPTSAGSGRARDLMLSLLRKACGDFHFNPGDRPRTENLEGGELEPPILALPLWELDQFVVSDPGEEPNLAGELEGLGYCRNMGVKAYIQEFHEMLQNISTEKVYTFASWRISRFVDCIQWHFKSPFGPQDLGKFLGQGPLYVFMYEFTPEADEAEEAAAPARSRLGRPRPKKVARHVPSRVRHFFKLALWSLLKPPPAKKIAGLAIPSDESLDMTPQRRRRKAWYSKSEVKERLMSFLDSYMGSCWSRRPLGNGTRLR